MKHAVVTGASTGIGRSTVAELVQHDFHVFAGVRSANAERELSLALGSAVTPVRMDVTEGASVLAAAEAITAGLGGAPLDALVNCAGVGGSGPLQYQPLDEVRNIFEVNTFGMLAVIQALLPLLGASAGASRERAGRIVNVSSVGGRIAFPFLGAYAGSKHAVEALSDSLRRELSMFGIDVIVVEPGSVRTPIWDKAEQASADAYASTPYSRILAVGQPVFIGVGRRGMPPEAVARVIRLALQARRPRTRYALPGDQNLAWRVGRWLPDRWFDRLISLQLQRILRKRRG